MNDLPARIQEAYDRLPEIDCKGKCWNSCGPVDMHPAEHERIRERGVEIQEFTELRSYLWKLNAPLYCSALTEDKRCSVHDVRPLICRLWGVVKGLDMECPHGCEIDGEPLGVREAMRLLTSVMMPEMVHEMTDERIDQTMAFMEESGMF